MPSLVLGVDTSTVVSVGLARDGQVIGTATVPDRRAHVEQLTPAIRRCLAEAGVRAADLTQIVVGLGPGPFTGLRVGIVTAEVLALALDLPLHGVCSLDVLAVQYAAEHPSPAGEFVAATDARRREVYWARYGRDGVRLDGPAVSAPENVPGLPTVGPAADLYPDRLDAVPGPRALDPGVLAAAGPQLPAAGRAPLYLRRPDAAEPGRPKPVSPPERGSWPRRDQEHAG